MNFIAVFLIGISLSMDAFAVSICQGLIPSKHNKKDMEKIAFTFGFFQFSMTFLGGIAGKIVLPFVKGYEYIIPCIIFCGIAVFMLKEGWEHRKNSCELVSHMDNFRTLFLLGIATSMDALFIGISFALEINYPLFQASILIGCITFVISAIGYYFGKSFSHISKNKAYYLGAVLLFSLGIHSLIR
ncbi:MAG TPA: manganese efflux pump MntP family protein [Fusobacterium sp.]|uniref:manganese efflux pump MntP n=1 Tax=Fusobacterium sp. TaxID=68766 RepID=UPI002F420304